MGDIGLYYETFDDVVFYCPWKVLNHNIVTSKEIIRWFSIFQGICAISFCWISHVSVYFPNNFCILFVDTERIHWRCWDRGGVCNKSILCGGMLIWYQLLFFGYFMNDMISTTLRHYLMKWRVYKIVSSIIVLWWTG